MVAQPPKDLARDAMRPHLALVDALDLAAPPVDVAAWLARVPAGRTADAPDLHRRFVERYDGPQHRDEARVARYLAALDAVRERADRGEALTLEGLASVQSIVLGERGAAPLRVADAFARAGAHRYPIVEGFEALVQTRLATSASPGVHPVVAASVAYLDVIFTHPFRDGNARAARLCLEWNLRRAGLATPRLEDLVRLRKSTGDASALWRMIRLCAALLSRSADGPHG